MTISTQIRRVIEEARGESKRPTSQLTKQILSLICEEIAKAELPKTNSYEDKMRSRLTVPSAILVGQQDMLKWIKELFKE